MCNTELKEKSILHLCHLHPWLWRLWGCVWLIKDSVSKKEESTTVLSYSSWWTGETDRGNVSRWSFLAWFIDLPSNNQKSGFPGGSDSKESACNVGDSGSIPGSGRSPGEGNGNTLQCSCLENPMDGGAWWATVLGVAKSRTQLSYFTSSFPQIARLLCCYSHPTSGFGVPARCRKCLPSWGVCWEGVLVIFFA